MKNKVTIKDIANMANVSKSTVSRYLNNGYVSGEKASKIKEIIEKTGFETNFFAKRLKTQKSGLVGLVIPRIDSVTIGKTLTGINRKLTASNYQGIIISSELSIEKELANINSLYQQGVDAIIVNSMAITKKHIELANRIDVPIIFTGQKNEYVNYINIDDYRAGEMMGDYIKSKGHKRIAFLGVSEWDKSVGIDRKKGFTDAVTSANKNCQVDFVETDFSFEQAYLMTKQALQYQPTMIVCATDNICLGVLRYLHEQEIKVPEEVSVAGFGGYEIGSVSYPALTTVAFDYERIGMWAAEGALALIDGEELQISDVTALQLVERESVRFINGR